MKKKYKTIHDDSDDPGKLAADVGTADSDTANDPPGGSDDEEILKFVKLKDDEDAECATIDNTSANELKESGECENVHNVTAEKPVESNLKVVEVPGKHSIKYLEKCDPSTDTPDKYL